MQNEINLFEIEPRGEWEREGGVSQSEEDPFKIEHVKRIIEALLFASSDPIPLAKIREVTDVFYPLRPKKLQEILKDLERDYLIQKRSFRLEEIANGYILRTQEEFKKYIDLLYRDKRGERLTSASMEVLAIIAYRGPITRPQIEAIRGVDSSGIVQALLDRKLIETQGKLDAPGKPTLYVITKDFLKHFGLKDLHELPKLEW